MMIDICEKALRRLIIYIGRVVEMARPTRGEEHKTQVACATFMNWSHDRARWASMSVYCTMRSGKKPINLR